MAIAITAALDPVLQVRTYERKLRQEAVIEDCFTALRGVHSTDHRVAVTDEIYLQIEGAANNGSRFHRIALSKALAGAAVEGSTGNQVGLEEDLIQKFFDIFYTDISHAVSLQSYGIEAKTKSYYQIFEEITPKLSLWVQEQTGRYIREALLETYSHNLTQQPHNLVQEFNPNIAIAGLHSSQWPIYSNVPATWTQRIGVGLNAAGVGAAASCTIRFLQLVEEWASTEKTIEPVMVGNKETYVCVLPSPQCRYLKDPIVAGNMGAVMAANSSLTQKEDMSYPGFVTRIGRLLICEDPRYPTLTLGGSAQAWSLTPQYKLPGRDPAVSDPRDKTLTARQVGYLLGKAALAEWKAEDWHWEYQYTRYDKFGGKGIFCSAGWTLVRWQFGPTNAVNPPTSATLQQDSSVVMLFSAPPALT